MASLALGYAFLGLGVLGLFLPILQGVVFIVVGLLILAPHSAWAGSTLDWVKRRHPRADELVTKAEHIVTRWVERVRGWTRRLLGRPA
jgi:uncharacterized protein